MIDAGQRDRRITIERATLLANDLNEGVKTWAPLTTVWAHRADVSDAEAIAAGELGASLSARFTLLRDDTTKTVAPKDRLTTDDGAIWNIQAVREKRDDPARLLIEIRATREVD